MTASEFGGFDGAAYQARIDELAASGVDVHGEATLLRSYRPRSVLDAGCGTGRVAAELARHGVEVVGVDLDASMLAEARRVAPGVAWVEADLSTLALGRSFDVVVLAGNVALFCPPARRGPMIAACAAHTGGVLVAGWALDGTTPLGVGPFGPWSLADHDAACVAAGLELEAHWAGWDRSPPGPGDTYAVTVHRRR